MSDDRRFDDAEVTRILRRAVEMQSPLPVRVQELARGEGLTLAQLESAASEAGIDAALVRQAASEIDLPEALRRSAFHGAVTRAVVERVVPRELDPAEFDAFLDEVRRALGITGIGSTTARSVTWDSLPPGSSATAGRRIAVSLVVRSGMTRLRVEEDFTPDAAGIFALGLGGGGIGGIVSLAVLLGISPMLGLVAPVIPVGAYLAARGGFRRIVDRRLVELNALAERLADLAGRGLK